MWWALKTYIIVNFRTHKINWDTQSKYSHESNKKYIYDNLLKQNLLPSSTFQWQGSLGAFLYFNISFSMASLITLTADFAGWFDIFRVILYYLCCMMFSSSFLSDYLIYIWSKFQSLADLYNLLFFKLIFFLVLSFYAGVFGIQLY